MCDEEPTASSCLIWQLEGSPTLLPEDFDFRDAHEAFRFYFVNNLIDYHAHELLQLENS